MVLESMASRCAAPSACLIQRRAASPRNPHKWNDSTSKENQPSIGPIASSKPSRRTGLGEFSFGPVKLKGDLITGRNDNRRWMGRSVFVVAPPLKIVVKTPPRENQPASYVGAIGEFEVRGDLTPKAAKAGDPLTLTLSLRGEGSLQDARAPDLQTIDAIASRFKIYPPAERITDDGWQAVYSLRPLSEAVTEFPELDVSYFDVRTEQFVTETLPAIPLTIVPADQLSTSDVTSAPRPVSPQEQSPLDDDGWYRDVADPLSVSSEPNAKPVWIATGLALLGLATAWVAGVSIRGGDARAARRRRRHAPSRAKQHLEDAERALAEQRVADAAVSLRQAVTEMASAILNADTVDCTPLDMRRRLAQSVTDPTLCEAASHILDVSDAARFGGDQVAMRDAVHKTRTWLAEVQRCLRGGIG